MLEDIRVKRICKNLLNIAILAKFTQVLWWCACMCMYVCGCTDIIVCGAGMVSVVSWIGEMNSSHAVFPNACTHLLSCPRLPPRKRAQESLPSLSLCSLLIPLHYLSTQLPNTKIWLNTVKDKKKKELRKSGDGLGAIKGKRHSVKRKGEGLVNERESMTWSTKWVPWWWNEECFAWDKPDIDVEWGKRCDDCVRLWWAKRAKGEIGDRHEQYAGTRSQDLASTNCC